MRSEQATVTLDEVWSSRVGARLVKAVGRHNGRQGPQVAGEPNPAHPDLIGEFRFFAVIKTWMDEDIIEATVRNAVAQGAEAVFLVDNGSTDATVTRAQAAGAVVADSYETDVFEGRISSSPDSHCRAGPRSCGGCCSTPTNFPRALRA